jgi:hypothetical protein
LNGERAIHSLAQNYENTRLTLQASVGGWL